MTSRRTLRRRLAAPVAVLAVLAGLLAPAPASATSHHVPVGRIDRATAVPGGLELSGWVVDEDTAAPVQVHLYENGVLVGAVWANETRNDIGAKFPALGPDHGFSTVVPISAATATVCAYAINRPSGTNPRLGCATTVRHPTGRVDVLSRRPGGTASTVRVQGWALDPDRQWGVFVHLYADGRLVGSALANEPRADIGALFPAYGPNHGFTADLLLGPGRHRVCAFAIDVGPGSNKLLGCGDVTVATLPVGVVDSITRGGGSFTVKGWAIDPDTTASTTVEVLVNGAPAGTLPADVTRSSLGLWGLVYGLDHGIDGTVPATVASPALVCAYGVNVELGSGTRLLGCRVV